MVQCAASCPAFLYLVELLRAPPQESLTSAVSVPVSSGEHSLRLHYVQQRRMTPNPLVYIYSGLLSRFVLLVKVLGSLVILGGLLWSYHLCGLWDLSYGTAKPASGREFLALAEYNPFSRLEAVVRTDASAWQQCQESAKRLPVTLPAGDPRTDSLRVFWHWVSSPQPLVTNPYPSLRVARVHTQWLQVQLLGWYYLSTQLGALICGLSGGVLWMFVHIRTHARRPRMRDGMHKLEPDDLACRPSTLTLPHTGFLSLGLPREVLRLASHCRTAREVLRVLSAHRQWPASLTHHGAQSGGLLAHTVRAVTLAHSHAGARDPALGTAFLLTVLAHDAGKILTYEPHPGGGYVHRSYAHANKSADLLVAVGIFTEFPRDLADAVLIALRSSTSKVLTPIPDNGPAAAKTLLHWLTTVDQQAVECDVAELQAVVEAADLNALLPRVLHASAPGIDLPPPLYRDGGTPYLVRDAVRPVVVTLLHLEQHPGVYATVGRRDPIWATVKAVLTQQGYATGEERRIEIPGLKKPLAAVPVSPEFVEHMRASV